MRSKALRFWETILWLLAALALVVPLFVVHHIVMNLVFIKLTAFQILVELMVAVYLILVGINPSRYRPRFSGLTVAMLLFAGALVVSTITSVQPVTSFWGDITRWNGLFAYLHYVAFFLVLSWSLKGKWQWLRLLQVAIWVSLAIALYSLAQYWGLPLVREATGERLVGPTSNALVLAEYCLLLFFPTIIYALRTKSRLVRWVFLGTAALQLVTIWLTESRGAMAALAVGLVVFSLTYIWLYYKKFFVRLIWLVAGLILLGGGLFWGLRQLPLANGSVLGRMISVSITDSSLRHRLYAWEIGLKAWSDRPLTGFGLDNFSIAFQRHYQPLSEEQSAQDAETWFDRAHNVFIDYLVMTGLLGLLTYIAVLLMLLVYSVRAVVLTTRPKWQRAIAGALLSAFSAYIVFGLLAFDVVSAFIILFFLLALLNSFYLSVDTDSSASKRSRWGWYIVSLVVVIGLLPLQIRMTTANRVAGRAATVLLHQDVATGMALLNQSLAYNTPIRAAIMARMLEAGGQLISKQDDPTIRNALLEMANLDERYISQSLNGQHFSVLANFYGQLLLSDPTLLDKVNATYARAVELAPNRPLIYLAWGSNLTRGGYSKLALDKYQQAVEIAPDMPLAQFWLGLGYVALNHFSEGEQAFNRAAELDFDRSKPDNLLLIANAFEIAGAYPRAEAVYKQIIQATGGQAESYYLTVEFYQRIGWSRQALMLAEDYLKISPNDSTMLQIVEKIKQNK